MPAQGRGANLDASRRIGAPRRKPPAAAPAPRVNLTALSSEPFKPAQQQAQRRVVQAQKALPKQPTPSIPRIEHPTPTQTAAALQIAHRAQQQAVGPRPSAAQIRNYQTELLNDPRQHEYVKTIEHYARAAQEHAAELAGRIQAGGGHGIDSALTPAALKLSRQEAVDIGSAFLHGGPRATAKPAPAPKDVALPLFGAATIRIPGTAKLGGDIASALSKLAPGLSGNTPEESFARNIGKDALGLGELPFVGGYQVANAGLHAATGDVAPAKRLVSGVAQGLEQGAAGQLLQGNLKGAEAAVREHPLYSALEALGVSGVAGRVAGALARGAGSDVAAAGARGALARAGSTVRSPIALTDDAGLARRGTAVRQRSYSPDLLRKLVQVASDKTREPLRDARGNIVTTTDRGREVSVLKPRSEREAERIAKRRANHESSRTQSVENVERENVRKTVNAAVPGRNPRATVAGAVGRELTQLVATGTIRSVDSFRADLEKRAKRVETAIAHPENFRTRKELKAAQDNAKLLRKAADSPDIEKYAPRIMEQGHRLAEALNKGDVRIGNLDVHPKAQLERSALSEYALAHMGARHFKVADHQAAETAARVEEGRAAAMVRHTPAGTPERDAAVADLRRARAYRMDVSGRGAPEHIAAHEQAHIDLAEARRGVRDAGEQLKRAERARATQVGVHASRRGSQGLRGATAAEKAASDVARQRVETEKANVRTAQERLKRAEGDVSRSKLPKIREAIRHPDGGYLSNQEIRAHAHAHGRNPDTLAYVPHVLGSGRKGAYHQPFEPGSRPAPRGPGRTGVLYNRGATVIGKQIVHDELASKATTANKAEALDKFASEHGVTRPDGKYFTAAEALETAKRKADDGLPEVEPMRAFGAKLDPETQARLQDAQSPAAMETAHLAMLDDRIVKGEESGARNVVLVNKHLVDALKAQLKPSSELEKSVQLLNAPFRMAVLPQPRWLTGNFIEPYFVRLPLSGAGINLPGALMDVRAGSKLLKAMERSGDPRQVRAAKEIRAQQEGGLFIGRRGASVRRTHEDFPGNLGRALYAAHIVRNLPVVKQLGDMALSLPHAFFHINRVIETAAQRQALGRSVRRDVQQFTGKWSQTVLLGQKALSDVGKGLVNTAAQHRFMEAQHEILGQYDSFNPTMRKLVQTVAPFLPWTLASMRFVFWTVPAHHTVAFTVLMKAAQSVQVDWEQEHADVPPGTLKDAIVRKDGGLVDLERYTPYGATSPPVQGDLSSLPDTVLPQLSGSIKALEGQDPFGRELQVPKTPGNPKGQATGGQKAEVAVNSLIEALVPLVAQARRLREGGGTAYANSTLISPKVKPGSSHMSALERTFSPIRPTYLKKPSGGGGDAKVPAAPARALERTEKHSSFDSARLQRAIERAEKGR